MNRTDRWQEQVSRFKGRRIAVIGDVMLDEFIWGHVSRISPEAPVPIVEVQQEEFFPGGAANVARSLRALGARVELVGRIGNDAGGKQLRALLRAEGIGTRHLVVSQSVPTTVKTRIVARPQQVVRVDRERIVSLEPKDLSRALSAVEAAVTDADAVILEDYAKGFVVQPIATLAGKLCRGHRLLTVDPNPKNPLHYPGASVIKPNRTEAFAAAGRLPTDDLGVCREVGAVLLKKWKVGMVLMTLGEHGMLLVRKGATPYLSPSKAQEVFDVSGAGDTAIAAFTLALSAGASPEDATEISNHASGVVVGKLGTAVVTPEELVASFQNFTPA
jgi:D-beta-D-heptose 7-phosphate kinase/D-beta-D-heptose 1-phosphate adenosyltransferase